MVGPRGLRHESQNRAHEVSQHSVAKFPGLPSLAGKVLNALLLDVVVQVIDADVLVFPSAWVEDDGDQRDTLLPALDHDFDLAVLQRARLPF